MKNVILFSLLVIFQLHAAPGCLDNSWHMARPFDTKTYHVVEHWDGRNVTHCQCHCDYIHNGVCRECKHRHDMIPLQIIRYER